MQTTSINDPGLGFKRGNAASRCPLGACPWKPLAEWRKMVRIPEIRVGLVGKRTREKGEWPIESFCVTGSPEQFAQGLYVPEEMVKDLLEIANLAPAAIDQLATALEGEVLGFLDDVRLGELVHETVPDPAIAESICRVVQNIRPSNVGQSLDRLRLWREADPRRNERMPVAAVAAIATNLPRLIRPFPRLTAQGTSPCFIDGKSSKSDRYPE